MLEELEVKWLVSNFGFKKEVGEGLLGGAHTRNL